jgi:hypothetical protein
MFGKKSKDPAESQNKPDDKQPGNRSDTLFAVYRRLEQRLAYVEEKVSTLRRDLSRIDKKVYREEATPLPPPATKREDSIDTWIKQLGG